MYIIAYDVNTSTQEGRKRLRKVAKECCNYGIRVQNSVFECKIESAAYVIFKAKLLGIINSEEDSLRIYNIGSNYTNKIESFGFKHPENMDGILLL